MLPLGSHARLYSDIRQSIESFAVRLKHIEISPQTVYDAPFSLVIRELEQFVRDPRYEPFAAEVVHSGFFQEQASFFRRIYGLCDVFFEVQACLEMLHNAAHGAPAYALEAFSPDLLLTAEGAVEEARRAGVTSSSRVAFVGSGPLPESAIAISERLGCEVVCIDVNPEAVLLSSRLLHVLGLDKRIHVRFMDATEISFADFTHVFVAVLAHPKDRILRRICETGAADVRVVCRTATGLRSLLYEPAHDLVLEHFDILDKVEDITKTTHSAFILERRTHTHP